MLVSSVFQILDLIEIFVCSDGIVYDQKLGIEDGSAREVPSLT